MLFEFPNIDPIALQIGPIAIRWYALAYLTGFLGGWFLAGKFATADGDKRPNNNDIDDLLTWIIFGVILGGRMGYVLFYNFDYYSSDLLAVFKVWEGGMAFHGGLIGAILAMVAYSRTKKIPLLQITDIVAAVAPLGIFFGRLANFINGELYGRITDSQLGMIFPEGGELPRHPSQLYEALLEGLVLFVVMMILVKKGKLTFNPGYISAVFLCLYGAFRFIVEYFREPDIQIGLFLDFISMGQILCLPMILGGVLVFKYRQKLNSV